MRRFMIGVALLGLVSGGALLAAPDVSVDVLTEREVVDPVSGKTVREPARDAEPGNELIYTIRFANLGDETATDLVVDNPLPTGVSFVADSATGPGELRVSADRGRTFAAPDALTLPTRLADGRTVQLPAPPDRYTDVQWVLDRLPAATTAEVGFRVRVR